MSKAFISQSLFEADLFASRRAARRAVGILLDAIVKEMRRNKKFTLPGFGTFAVRKMKARKGTNPRTGESIKIKASKTVRFKPSRVLRKAV